jgi:hypothetical protein
MKKLFVLALAATLTPIAAAKVWISVYRCDGATPLAAVDSNHPNVYRDVMVGTRLTLVLSSDTSDYWCGSLRLSWDDAQYAKLSGRGYTATLPGTKIKIPNYKGSCLDAAGTRASVQDFMDSGGGGLDFSSDHTPYISGGHPAYPGDWFVVDYHAEQVGNCKVGLYDLFAGFDVPIQTMFFTHVPSRDFNGDTVVDLKDFALFASHWRSAVDPNASPGAALDLNADGRVNASDLASFSEYWLERTDCNESPAPSGIAVKP